ncbi:MAG: 6-hydroxycyclohex-1-ene-1-carbonyl-CoA dehydrogenase [Deltaproteobacteria bacterium]|nr:6-hydroxycyclohex-1-ene-1-carbonyl-CoA dehydrogenase [Deltaproteobacteria bacterium]
MTSSLTCSGYMMTAVAKPLESRSYELEPLAAGEALVKVAGCGLCHTDISFLHLGVKTRKELPLVLGHEVSGVVEAVGAGVSPDLVGRPVVVPAVLPCGTCDLCQSGHRPICRAQIMPGNDRHGGFADKLSVPARYLCPVKDEVLKDHELWQLAVVADAVSTPFMAVARAEVRKNDPVVVIGTGGIGIYCVQIAAACGGHVVAVDVDDLKLEQAKRLGAKAAINVKGLAEKEVRAAVTGELKKLGTSPYCTKIFETSGTRAGQLTGFSLLNHGASMAVVGFTMDKLEVRLSNLMAFDATLRGNWGCDPELYPEILEWIADGRIQIRPLVKRHPLAAINEVLEAAHAGRLEERAVLVP